MRFLLATAIIASLAAPAFAQDSHVPRYGEEDKEKTASQKAADKAAADAYQRSLGAIPDKGSTDPWGTVRNDTPKTTTTKAPATKTTTTKTKAKAKTSSADTKPPQ
ncbi:MAG: hypothetical protein JO141_18245 [Bradyrhizobium sp.]|nr:hypothetical protein [Bradyrhizobium sp.]